MIRELTSLDPCTAFAAEMAVDPLFSANKNLLLCLLAILVHPDEHLFGVFRGNSAVGLFGFLILDGERYAEMLVGFAREDADYAAMAGYLETKYPGYQFNFVYNPADRRLTKMLRSKGAVFYEEQQKMVLSRAGVAVDTTGVEPLCDRYLAQYLALHNDDRYWTGEKVAAAPNRFHVFLAVEDGTVVGYTDVTNRYNENEPFMLEVAEPYRRRGWGRKLLAKAIAENGDRGMRLHVYVNNTPAIMLYASLGFVKVEGENTQTVTWEIPA